MDSFQSYVVPGEAKYYGPRRALTDVDTIIVHATEGHSADESVSWLNRVLKTGESKASYHYVIASDQRIIRMLPIFYIAYHAGVSAIPPKTPGRFESVNRRSIGIAFDTLDSPSDPLTQWQRDACLWLCYTFCSQYHISPYAVFAHREVAPGRKHDPVPEIFDIVQFRNTLNAAL